MSDLVARLREWHEDSFGEIFKEAADRIDQLESMFEWISNMDPQLAMDAENAIQNTGPAHTRPDGGRG